MGGIAWGRTIATPCSASLWASLTENLSPESTHRSDAADPRLWTLNVLALLPTRTASIDVRPSGGPPGLAHDSPRTQTCTFERPGASNTTKIPRKRPKEREKRMKNCGGRGKKKREILGPHHSGPHPSGAPPFGFVVTDFGQTDFGHPYLTDFGQSDFGQTDFGQNNLTDFGQPQLTDLAKIGVTDFGQTDFGQFWCFSVLPIRG